jgi:hypothetical protein
MRNKSEIFTAAEIEIVVFCTTGMMQCTTLSYVITRMSQLIT